MGAAFSIADKTAITVCWANVSSEARLYPKFSSPMFGNRAVVVEDIHWPPKLQRIGLWYQTLSLVDKHKINPTLKFIEVYLSRAHNIPVH